MLSVAILFDRGCMLLQSLSRIPLFFKNLHFLLFYIYIQAASPFSCCVLSKGTITLCCFPLEPTCGSREWPPSRFSYWLTLLCCACSQGGSSMRGTRVRWGVTAGADGEWKQVAGQTSWQNRTDCLPAISPGKTALATKLWGWLSPISWI